MSLFQSLKLYPDFLLLKSAKHLGLWGVTAFFFAVSNSVISNISNVVGSLFIPECPISHEEGH